MLQNNEIMGDRSMVEFTKRLKREDDNYANLSKGLQMIYWILLFVYSILVIRHIVDNSSLEEILGSVCFMIGMLIFALFFGNYYREYKYVDYSQPTLVMLKKAAYRYKPFQLKTIWALLGILFIDAGLTLNHSFGDSVVITQFIFLGAIGMALIVGLLIWIFRYKPLRDEALFLIREITGEN